MTPVPHISQLNPFLGVGSRRGSLNYPGDCNVLPELRIVLDLAKFFPKPESYEQRAYIPHFLNPVSLWHAFPAVPTSPLEVRVTEVALWECVRC